MKAMRTLLALGLVGLFLAAAMPAMGGPAPVGYNLTDDNSFISVDLTSGAGINSWVVDGITHLETQWFWYRTGAMPDEAAISTLPLTISGPTDTNFDTFHDTAYVKYTDVGTGFTVELRTSLDGGATGTGHSTLAEQITIKNTSASNLTFHFFQYTDFNLGGTPLDDTINIVSTLPDSIFQSDPKYHGDTVVVPKADAYEAGDAATLLAKFSDGASTTLLNVATAGTGDVAWALQWDRVIEPNKTFQIVIGKEIAPEPATMAMLALGGAGLFLTKRRRG